VTAETQPMIPLAVPDLTGNEAQYLQDCITSTYVSSIGPFVDQFEGMVSAATGAEAAVATSSGTAGLHVALVAVGVGRDDLVILPSFTFIASANAIAQCGAEPWLFDVTTKSWTLDPNLLRTKLETETRAEGGECIHAPSGRRVAAIMPVHTLGLPAHMDSLVQIAGEFGIPIIADAAPAIGATYKGRPIGKSGADLSVLSFNGNKTVTSGGGGAVIGDNGDALDLVRHLSSTARTGADYDHDRAGFNYRMTNLQAAVGCAQMERLEDLVAAKRRIRRAYEEAFTHVSDAINFPSPDWAESSCWFSGVVWQSDPDGLRARLHEAGIIAKPFWKPVHLQKPYAGSPRTEQDVTEDIWRRIVILPCSSNLTDDELARVIKCIA
jgi:perosamine synthetase